MKAGLAAGIERGRLINVAGYGAIISPSEIRI